MVPLEAVRVLYDTSTPAWDRERTIAEFIDSEISIVELGKLASEMEIEGRSKLSKSEKAAVVARKAATLESHFDDVQRVFLRSPKRWLALRIVDDPDFELDLDELPGMEEDRSFLDEVGASGWYGPVRYTREDDTAYYIGVVTRRWTGADSSLLHVGRWNIVAVVRKRSLSFHWKNLGSPKGLEATHYWQHVKKAINTFAKKIPGDWVEPDLKELLLESIWANYRDNDEFTVEDTFVFAREQGISLTAAIKRSEAKAAAEDSEEEAEDSSQGIADLARIANLTDTLTELALESAGVLDDLTDKQLQKAKTAVKHAFIKGWNTRRYECIINQVSPKRKVFLAKAFFGDDEREGSFQHLRSDPEYGSSWGAAEFLLKELNVW